MIGTTRLAGINDNISVHTLVFISPAFFLGLGFSALAVILIYRYWYVLKIYRNDSLFSLATLVMYQQEYLGPDNRTGSEMMAD